MLWYSEADQKRWRAYVKKHDLDPNTDVRVRWRRMEQLWLRPLSRVFQAIVSQPYFEDGNKTY
jgi:hypothetical protein